MSPASAASPAAAAGPAHALPATLEAARFLRAMERAGWQVRACRHSRHELVHAATGRTLDVAFHERLGRATVERVLARAGLPAAGFLPRTGTA